MTLDELMRITLEDLKRLIALSPAGYRYAIVELIPEASRVDMATFRRETFDGYTDWPGVAALLATADMIPPDTNAIAVLYRMPGAWRTAIYVLGASNQVTAVRRLIGDGTPEAPVKINAKGGSA